MGSCLPSLSWSARSLIAANALPCLTHAALASEPAPDLRLSLGAAGADAAANGPAASWFDLPSPSILLATTLVFAVLAVLAVAALIRTRRLAGMAEARFYQFAAQGSDVLLRTGGEKRAVSGSVVDLLGYSADEMTTLDWSTIVHPDDRERAISEWRSSTGSSARRLAYRLIRRDGGIVFAEANICRLVAAGRAETIVTLRDVTAQHQENDDLRRAIEAARAAEAEAAEASRAKGDFLATMSHEIRTPLNAIIGFADLIIADDNLSPVARRHAERVKAGGDALLTVVNDILDFSQIEAGALHLDPRPFALPLLIDECIALVETSARSRNLALRVSIDGHIPPGVIGDEARLRQILLNLINNAIKFTEAGSITLRIGRNQRDQLLFEVEDSGIGIAPADLSRLFERFRQVDGTVRRTHGGTGLGLAICKMLVEAMGGTIGVRSVRGVGSTFWFTLDLPTVRLRLETAVRPVAPAKAVRPLKVLLAEDVRLNQELVLAVLEAAGHSVDLVGDGADALMAAEHFGYDLCLMDIQMPHIDGMTATRAIRRLPQSGRLVPIIGLSANVLPTQIEAAIAAGMDDFLPKPLTLDSLGALLARAEAGRIHSQPDAAAHDAEVLGKLASVLGDAKIRDMLGTLESSLLTRFTTQLDEGTVPALKAEAHAVLAGSGMLGFKRFATLCRRFIASEGEAAIAAGHDDLLREMGCVIRHAGALSRQETIAGRLVA